MNKKWYASKTFWFNILALAVLIANSFGFANFNLSPDFQQLAIGAVAAINIGLRFITNKGITLS